MSHQLAIQIDRLSHRYGDREAVSNLSLDIKPGEIFALLGPNGSGKTTLFRVLSTLIPLQSGEVSMLGHNLRTDPESIRRLIGVVFQSPSLDKKLTVSENLRHHGRLYGLSGTQLGERSSEMLNRLGLIDRSDDLVEALSGGLRRRVELAQGMLHQPRLLILDEPSTGLDPGARSDMWHYLGSIRRDEGVTVLLTTHLLEEAERADRIGIMHQGKLAAVDSPAALRHSIGGDAITIRTPDAPALASQIDQQFDCQTSVIDDCVRLEQPDGHQWIARLVDTFPNQIDSITLGKPTLEDVFIHLTGHQYWTTDQRE